MDINREYFGKKVLLIGGLGFIGSSLARELASLGAEVSILTKNREKEANISDFKDKIRIISLDQEKIKGEDIKNQDIIFDLAEKKISRQILEVSDLEEFLKDRKDFVNMYKKSSSKAKVVYASSRLVYGLISEADLPINENMDLKPFNLYGHIKKESEEIYKKSILNCVILRIAVAYGEGAYVKSPTDGIIGWFIRRALKDEELKVYENTSRLRDFIYLQDLISAFLVCGIHHKATNNIFNVGSGEAIRLIDAAEKITKKVGGGRVEIAPNQNEVDKIDNFYIDTAKINRELGWRCLHSFDEGLDKTIEFYRAKLDKYI